MIRSLLLFFLMITSICAFTQIPDAIDHKLEEVALGQRDTDSTYIKYFDEFGIHLYNVLYLNSFSLVDNNQNSTLKYSPAASPAIGIGFTKYGFSFNASQDFGLVRQDEGKFGETKSFNLNVSFLYKKMGFTAYISKYNGYYISNPSDFDVGWNNESYPQRPDVQSIGYGLSHTHVFNSEKFSLNASYTLTQKQLKSAGSFILGEFINGYHITGDSSLIPDTIVNQFAPHLAIVDSDQFTFGLMGGYSYTLVFLKNFTFNLTVLPGALFSVTDIKTENPNYNTNSHVSIRPNIFYNGALSYVRERYYVGLQANASNYWLDTGDNIGINYQLIKAKVFVGYRLGSGKK